MSIEFHVISLAFLSKLVQALSDGLYFYTNQLTSTKNDLKSVKGSL